MVPAGTGGRVQVEPVGRAPVDGTARGRRRYRRAGTGRARRRQRVLSDTATDRRTVSGLDVPRRRPVAAQATRPSQRTAAVRHLQGILRLRLGPVAPAPVQIGSTLRIN